jgi:hypothetical protein
MLEALTASEEESSAASVRPALSGGPAAGSEGLPGSTRIVVGTVLAVLVAAAAYWLGRQDATVEAGGGPADSAPLTPASGHADLETPSGNPSIQPEGASPDEPSPRSEAGDPAVAASGSAVETDQAPAGAGGAAAAGDLTVDDRRFFEKSNRFTVRAIYYGNTPRGWLRALATYRYLRDLGLPAVAPIDQGNELVLCVGAEPTREGPLSEYRSRLRALPGPPPSSETGAFAGAYFVNIDDLVDR